MSSVDQAWLHNYLGYTSSETIDYSNLYKQPGELIKVVSLVLFREENIGRQYQGRPLHEIDINDRYFPNVIRDQENTTSRDNVRPTIRKRSRRFRVRKSDPDEPVDPETGEARKVPSNLGVKQNLWSEDEIAVVKRVFSRHFTDLSTAPMMIECRKAIRNNPELKGRTWIMLKKKIYNAQRNILLGKDIDAALASKNRSTPYVDSDGESNGNSDPDDDPSEKPASMMLRSHMTPGSQQLWTESEISTIKRVFQKHFLDLNMTPKRTECERAIKKNRELRNRTWSMVSKKVYNAQKNMLLGKDIDTALQSKTRPQSPIKQTRRRMVTRSSLLPVEESPCEEQPNDDLPTTRRSRRLQDRVADGRCGRPARYIDGEKSRDVSPAPSDHSSEDTHHDSDDGGDDDDDDDDFQPPIQEDDGDDLEQDDDQEPVAFDGTKWKNASVTSQLKICPSGREYFKWTKVQTDAVEKFFKSHLYGENFGRVPSKIECLLAQRKYPVLKDIPWAKIKHKVYNNQVSLKRIRSAKRTDRRKSSATVTDDEQDEDGLPGELDGNVDEGNEPDAPGDDPDALRDLEANAEEFEGTKWKNTGVSQQLKVCPSGREYFKWSKAQSDVVDKFFYSYLYGKNRGRIPGKRQCVEAQMKYPVLESIPWSKIKHKVYNNQIALKRNPNMKPTDAGFISNEEDTESQDNTEGLETRPVLGRSYNRNPWTDDELDAIHEGFGDYFTEELNVHPGKEECEMIMEDLPILQPRGWKLVKHCVINLQKKCQKFGPDRVL